MKYQADIRDHEHTLAANLCEDGYVRLTFEILCHLPLFHLFSGLDEDDHPPLSEGAIPTIISGYTEWVSATTPAITIGWDWLLTASQGLPNCVRVSEPRSNIMLVDAKQGDLGRAMTATLINQAIGAMAWSDTVLKHINSTALSSCQH